jgi:hypothetical protein
MADMILTEAGTVLFTVKVMVLDVAGFPDGQLMLEVITQ